MSDSDQFSTDTSPVKDPGPARIKVMALVKQTYATVFGNFGDMMKIVWVAMVLEVVYGLYQTRALWGASSGQGYVLESRGVFGGIIEGLVVLLIVAAVSVAVLRYALLGQAPAFPGFAVGKRELRYWGYLILYAVFLGLLWIGPFSGMAALTVALAQAFGSLGNVVFILQVAAIVGWFLFVLMLAVRLGFVFPALALDLEGGMSARFGYAWQTAKGHTATIIGAFIVAVLPWVAVSALISLFWVGNYTGQIGQGQISFGSFTAYSVVDGFMSWTQFVVHTVLFANACMSVEALRQNAGQNPSALDEA